MLYEDGVVYRPPLEAESVLLETAYGCSHSRCTFCRYAAGTVPLQLVEPERLTENLALLAAMYPDRDSMFLLGGNVLAFRTAYLTDLMALIRRYMPRIRRISMYARGDDVNHKSREQLRALRDAGLGTLYIGLESGCNEILAAVEKGETASELLTALHTLDELGIPYGLSAILGLGGRSLSRKHALETAAFLGQVHPASVRLMTLTPQPGTPLQRDVETGRFVLLTPEEILREERLLIERLELDVEDCLFVATHVSNSVPLLGHLPRCKPDLLAALDDVLAARREGSVPAPRVDHW